MNISYIFYEKIMKSWWLLKLAYGLFFIIIGFDKYFNFLYPWQSLISSMILQFFHSNLTTFLQIIGAIEVVIGLSILLYTIIGAYAAAIWLFLMVMYSVGFTNWYFLAVHYALSFVGVLVLIFLTQVHDLYNQSSRK